MSINRELDAIPLVVDVLCWLMAAMRRRKVEREVIRHNVRCYLARRHHTQVLQR